METTIQRHNGFNLPVKQHELPLNKQIETGYITLSAANINDATKYMDENYNGMKDGILGYKDLYSFEPCHMQNKNEFSFIVKRRCLC